jgi:hypothetical protein
MTRGARDQLTRGVQATDRRMGLPLSFFVGANLPWVDYGCDFGANAWHPDGGLGARPDARSRFEGALDRLAAGRVSIVRVFLLCDGRAGIRFDADGAPLSLDDAFFRDADIAFDSAADRGLHLLPVLFDFHLCGAPQKVNGVQLGGRSALLTDPALHDRLLASVVRPIAERYGTHPGIGAWDLFNEPEWCTRPPAAASDDVSVPTARMRACLALMAGCFRAEATQPVTVGSASTSHLEIVRGLGLDFYQVHWYEPFGWEALSDPIERLALDGPVLLGEFPGRLTEVSPSEVISTARRAGYSGALVWSVLSEDSASGYAESLIPVNDAAEGGRP